METHVTLQFRKTQVKLKASAVTIENIKKISNMEPFCLMNEKEDNVLMLANGKGVFDEVVSGGVYRVLDEASISKMRLQDDGSPASFKTLKGNTLNYTL